MANEKTLPNILGSETIASSWSRLLTRDRNISTLFAGDSFTTDQTSSDVGRPNWRTDQNKLYIWNGSSFIDLLTSVTPENLPYITDNPDIPEGVNTLKGVIDALVERNLLNTVTLPADGVKYTADGTTDTYNLPRTTTNKYSLFVFIDGVKQESSTYDLGSNYDTIIFSQVPNRGEVIEIVQHASLTEWDYSPNIQYFTGDGSNKVFNLDFDVLRPEVISVNVSGTELQKSQFSVTGTNQITLITAPANGASVQISAVGRTSLISVSPNSIGTDELKAGSVTKAKLADGIAFNINMIGTSDISSAMLANSSVTNAKLADNSVSTSKIVNNAVTEAKLATAVQGKLLGNGVVDTQHIKSGAITEAKLDSTVIAKLNNTGGGGSGGSSTWGSIGGTLSDQTDLQTALNGKMNNVTLATVATSGSYNDLSNTPTIPTVPTNLSSFTDDLGTSPTHTHSQYLTQHQSLTGYQTTSNLVTSLSNSSTDSQYPSAKCVYDLIGDIDTALASIIAG